MRKGKKRKKNSIRKKTNKKTKPKTKINLREEKYLSIFITKLCTVFIGITSIGLFFLRYRFLICRYCFGLTFQFVSFYPEIKAKTNVVLMTTKTHVDKRQ